MPSAIFSLSLLLNVLALRISIFSPNNFDILRSSFELPCVISLVANPINSSAVKPLSYNFLFVGSSNGIPSAEKISVRLIVFEISFAAVLI